MKRLLLIAVGIAVLPIGVAAQTEIGLDAGATILRAGGSTATLIQVPTSWARIGFHTGDQIIFESLVTALHTRGGGSSATVLTLIPGLTFLLDEKGYLRGEVGIQYGSGGGSSATDWGFGGAVGRRKPILNGAAIFRIEGGLMVWPNDGGDLYQFRFVLGLSTVLN